MANNFYTHTNFPSTGAPATSASMRAELDLISAGFDKLPALGAGTANRVIVVDPTGNFLTHTSLLTLSEAGALSLTGTVSVSGALSAGSLSVTGALSAGSLSVTGTLSVKGVSSTTGSFSDQITSTVATGRAPFIVSSTTPVANLSIGGNAATATNAVNVNVTTTANNASYPIVLSTGQATGNQALLMDSSGGTYNPATNTAEINISGNAATATTATTVADNAITTLKIANDAVTLDKFEAAIRNRIGTDGALSGFRNRIINGACDISQRASISLSAGSGYGGPDRFYVGNTAAGGQFTQSPATLTIGGITKNTVRQTVNTAVTNITAGNFWGGIDQRIEGFNSYDLRGKQVAISFVFSTNVTGTYSVALRDGTGSQSYVTTISATANTPQRFVFSLPSIPAAASIPASNAIGLIITIGELNTGTFQTATPNAWQSGNFVTATGSTNWGATAGNFIELTELQLEEGSVATPFERRSYGVELALCQRYYATVSNAVAFSGNVTSTGGYFANYLLPVTMRTSPTLAATNLGASGFPTTVGTLSTQADSRTVNEARTANATQSGTFGSSITASAEL